MQGGEHSSPVKGGKSFSVLLNEKRELVKQLRGHRDEQAKIQKKIDAIKTEETEIEKHTKEGFRSSEEVKEKLQEIEKAINTMSVTPQEERKMIKEKQFFEKSVSYAKRFDVLKPQKDELFTEKRRLGKIAADIRSQLDQYNETLDSMNDEWKA